MSASQKDNNEDEIMPKLGPRLDTTPFLLPASSHSRAAIFCADLIS